MLKLINIIKDYQAGDNVVHALKGINITFNEKGIVGILGPSGCGKSTLLNIIGGLDKYTSGDLIINGRSTKTYTDLDWDTYRNHSIGFIFQQYNLISHLTLVENVELALTIAGLTSDKKREMSHKALEQVGLGNIENKYPNQLSGGQQQRVAIARAIVNNPDIILADEPTGALDTETSIQVMEILKKIGKEKLIIMVTHNPELAVQYSDRIIRVKDGLIQSDTAPIDAIEEAPQADDKNKPSMNFWTAIKLSFKNLVSKKGRTITTGLAGSIGIIGIALILAFSNGTTKFMNKILDDAITTTPIKVASLSLSADAMNSMLMGSGKGEMYPNSENGIKPHKPEGSILETNNINDEYVAYVNKLVEKDSGVNYASAIQRGMKMPLNMYHKTNGNIYKVDTQMNVYTEELPVNRVLPDVPSLIEANYDNIAEGFNGSHIPASANEIALVVDAHSNISTILLDELGIDYADSNGNILEELPYDKIIGKEFTILLNDAYYSKSDRVYKQIDLTDPKLDSYVTGDAIANKTIKVKITAVLRPKRSLAPSMILMPGLGYTNYLIDEMLKANENSEVVKAQEASPNKSVITGLPFQGKTDDLIRFQYNETMKKLGGIATPSTLYIYASNQANKQLITDYLDAWNEDPSHAGHQMAYIDSLAITSTMLNTIMNTITIVLACFSGISLVVSSIMIGIITYVSVIERTKEIGVLRALGASKRNIRQVFNAETCIIGFLAGLLGVSIAYLLELIINAIFKSTLNIWGIADLTLIAALSLILISTILTSVAGLLPSNKAAKKDPVECLRSE